MAKFGWRWVAASVGWLLIAVLLMGLLVPSIVALNSIDAVARLLIIIGVVCVIVPLVAGALMRLEYRVGEPPVLAPWLLGLGFVALIWLVYRQPRVHHEIGQTPILFGFAMWAICSFSIEAGGRIIAFWRRRRTHDSRSSAALA